MVLLLEEEEPNGRQKDQRSVEALHSSEPQKVHLTGEFIVVGVILQLYDALFCV